MLRRLLGFDKKDEEEEEVEGEEGELSISEPTSFQRGVHVEHDATEGTFKGLPSAWRKALPDQLVANDRDKTEAYLADAPGFLLPTNYKMRRDNSVALSDDDDESVISLPYNFQHITHVQVDSSDPLGFRGLPEEWKDLLQKSGISKQETLEHPQIVLDILEFRAGACKRPPAPRHRDFYQASKHAICLKLQNPNLQISDLQTIGEGSSGLVYFGTLLSSGRRVAVKRMIISRQTNIAALENEIAMMELSRHPNIVQGLDTYMWEKELWVVMEAMQGGSLCDLLAAVELAEPLVAYVCKQVTQALAFLHTRSRIHRDIKSDNILLGLDGTVKLADFGYCVQLTEEQAKRNSLVGTPYWMAPELIRTQFYDESVDVWSLGILTIESADRVPPLFDEPIMRALYLITSQPPPGLKDEASHSPEIKDFLCKCLVMHPPHRSRSEQLLCHAFLRKAAPKEALAAVIAGVKGLSGETAAAQPPAGDGGGGGGLRSSSAYQRARPNEEHV